MTVATARASAALERMAESLECGECLRAADVAHLTPSHLANILRHGDDYVREMIESLERERQRDTSRQMER